MWSFVIPSYHKASLELGPHYIQISCYSSPFSFYCIKACTIAHTHQSHSDEYFIYKNQFSLREMDGDLFDAPCVYVIVNSKVSYNATCWWCASPRQHLYTSVHLTIRYHSHWCVNMVPRLQIIDVYLSKNIQFTASIPKNCSLKGFDPDFFSWRPLL